MSNMGYCRFQSTLQDLRDCYDHINDEISEEEEWARERLVGLCKQIAEEVQ